MFYSNGNGRVTELALGAANTVLTSNGAAAAPTFTAPAVSGFAVPAIVLGTAAAAGAAGTTIRSDSTVIAFDATAPTTQAFSDAAAVGVINFAARRDHRHGMPANPYVAKESHIPMVALATEVAF